MCPMMQTTYRFISPVGDVPSSIESANSLLNNPPYFTSFSKNIKKRAQSQGWFLNT